MSVTIIPGRLSPLSGRGLDRPCTPYRNLLILRALGSGEFEMVLVSAAEVDDFTRSSCNLVHTMVASFSGERRDMTPMVEENRLDVSDIVQLARLALSGRPQDVQTYLRRLVRRYRDSSPEVAKALHALLRGAPSRSSPVRDASMAAIPVDTDSRLQLVRYEECPSIDVEPVWEAEVGEALGQIVEERRRESDLIQAGLAATKSVVLTGPPGVGKTLAARWLAQKIRRPLLTLDLAAVMSSFLGRTGTNVRNVLDYAKSIECVLLLDELDAVAKKRDDPADIGELKRLVNVLLQEIDDWPDSGLLIAATNHPSLLDPAVWRRFDQHIAFPMPSEELVRRAVAEYLKQDSISDAFKEALALTFCGQSFSHIERQINQIRRKAFLSESSLENAVLALIRVGNGSSKRNRLFVAKRLIAAGISQRQAHLMTGISRDTIRKALKHQST